MVNIAEFIRNVRLQLTPRRGAFVGGLTLTLVTIGYFLCWAGTDRGPLYPDPNYNHWQEFGKASFHLFLVSQFILLQVMATSAVGAAMIQERLRNTLILQQMTLLSPHEMLLGKLFGSTITCTLLAALLMPFALISASIAQIEVHNLFLMYLYLFVSSLVWQIIALFVSTTFAESGEAMGRNLLGIGYSIGGIAGLFSLSFFEGFWRNDWTLREETTYFYGSTIHTYLFAIGVLAFMGFWAYIGAIRSYKNLQLIKLSPRTIWYFFAALEAILVGLCWNGGQFNEGDYMCNGCSSTSYYYFQRIASLVIGYLLTNWLALTVLAGTSTISRNQLHEWWSAERDALSMFKRAEMRNALLKYPVAVVISILGLLALWISFSHKAATWNAQNQLSLWALGGIIVTFTATMGAMAAFIQFWAMYRFKAGNVIGVGLWILLFIILGIAASIAGEDSIPAMLNPVIYAAKALESSNSSGFSMNMVGGIIGSGIFATLCGLLLVWRWQAVRKEFFKV